MRKSSIISLALAATCWCSCVRAGILTTFQDAMQPTSPAPGWSYLWNSGGAIGDPANYSPLLPTSHLSYWYDSDGISGLPGPDPGGYLYLGPGQGHPGRGADSGIERYAIAAYTLNVSGAFSIVDSQLTNNNDSRDGLDLRIYVNDDPTPIFSGVTGAGVGSTLGFDTDLGERSAGDTIYVAIGGRSSDLNDTFRLRYGIAAVPEPSTLAMLGCGGLGLLGYAARRRWAVARLNIVGR